MAMLPPTVSTNLPYPWTYYNCLVDSVSARTLSTASYTDTSGMTEEACISYCTDGGYTYAGVEFGQECCE